MIQASYREALARGELKPDAAQENAVARLDELAQALAQKPAFWPFGKKAEPPRGLYIWGDVGRGKTLLMDLFFAQARVTKKRRAHFNRFMVDVHARIHAIRQRAGASDPIPVVARDLAAEARAASTCACARTLLICWLLYSCS